MRFTACIFRTAPWWSILVSRNIVSSVSSFYLEICRGRGISGSRGNEITLFELWRFRLIEDFLREGGRKGWLIGDFEREGKIVESSKIIQMEIRRELIILLLIVREKEKFGCFSFFFWIFETRIAFRFDYQYINSYNKRRKKIQDWNNALMTRPMIRALR